jgi:hypothetical protein
MKVINDKSTHFGRKMKNKTQEPSENSGIKSAIKETKP